MEIKTKYIIHFYLLNETKFNNHIKNTNLYLLSCISLLLLIFWFSPLEIKKRCSTVCWDENGFSKILEYQPFCHTHCVDELKLQSLLCTQTLVGTVYIIINDKNSRYYVYFMVYSIDITIKKDGFKISIGELL